MRKKQALPKEIYGNGLKYAKNKNDNKRTIIAVFFGFGCIYFAEIAEIRAVILQRMLCFFAGSRYIMIEKGRDCSL